MTPNPGIISPFPKRTFESRSPKKTDGAFNSNRQRRPKKNSRKLRPANTASIKKPRCLDNCQAQSNTGTKVYNNDKGIESSSDDNVLDVQDAFDEDDEDDDDDDIAIDDGLLDDVYESLPTNNVKREPTQKGPTQPTKWVTSPPRRNTAITPSSTRVIPRRRQTPQTNCIMGGRNKDGPVAGISILPTSNRWLPPGRSARSPIGSFPSSMTRGNGSSYAPSNQMRKYKSKKVQKYKSTKK